MVSQSIDQSSYNGEENAVKRTAHRIVFDEECIGSWGQVANPSSKRLATPIVYQAHKRLIHGHKHTYSQIYTKTHGHTQPEIL